jgi:hypothetical protein
MDIDSQRYDREANVLLRDPETMLTDKYNIPPMDFYTYDKKLTTNAKRIKQAYMVISEIREHFEDIRRVLQRYSSIMKEPDQVRRIENIGMEAIQKKIYRPARIMYKFSKEEKLSTFEDHTDVISDDMKAEKEAKLILDELTPRGIINKVLFGLTKPGIIPSKEKLGERYATEQTTSTVRKETEALRTEEVVTLPIEKEEKNGKEIIMKRIQRPAEFIFSDKDD